MSVLRRSVNLVLIMSLASFLAACQGKPASADGESESAKKDDGSIFASLKSAFVEETFEVTAGTPIVVRLDHGLDSDRNRPGESFNAHLDQAIERDGKLLAPKGSKVIGEITHVKDSGEVKGRAEMTLTLRELFVDGRSYELETTPLGFQAKGTKKRDAGVIAGSSALGAIVGAIAGGGKGAAIGAGVGAGAGTGVVLATEGKDVEFAPETRFSFRLSDSIELPRHKQKS